MSHFGHDMTVSLVCACVLLIAVVMRDAWIRWLDHLRWLAERTEAAKPDVDSLREYCAAIQSQVNEHERRIMGHDDALRDARVRGSLGGR